METTDLPQGQPANTAPDKATAPLRQAELPFARVQGQPVTQLPQDLYIPPDALEVILEAFEGPLDLLLYLIKRQNLDILHIKVAEITQQYMQYIELMDVLEIGIAAEYLVMAAMLAEIKSRMLLPRPVSDDQEEGDPRAELIRRLQEYERFKQAALDLDDLSRMNRDYWVGRADVPQSSEKTKPLPDIQLQEMLIVLSRVLKRAESYASHQIQMDPLSTRERMSTILSRVSDQSGQFVSFADLFSATEGRAGVIVTFIAVMELIREQLVEIVQSDAFAPIHLRAVTSSTEGQEQ